MITIFEFDSYKDFLRALIAANGRGYLAKLSSAAECHRSYLSSVLQRNSKIQLTHDHLFGIVSLLKLSTIEEDMLKSLLDIERATTQKYRNYLTDKIKNLRQQNIDLKRQLLKPSLNLEESSKSIYYSSWMYPAIHIATSIPSLQTIDKISKRLNISSTLVELYLKKLVDMDLVSDKDTPKFIWSNGDTHLPSSSGWIQNYHLHWRMQAIRNIERSSITDTHYSIVQSISKKDYEKLQFMLVNTIKKFQSIASPSDPEELIVLCLDFFQL